MSSNNAMTGLQMRLRRGQLSQLAPDESGSLRVAKDTFRALQAEISSRPKPEPIASVCHSVRNAGRRLAADGGPYRAVIGNITRRVLYCIRDVYREEGGKAVPQSSSSTNLDTFSAPSPGSSLPHPLSGASVGSSVPWNSLSFINPPLSALGPLERPINISNTGPSVPVLTHESMRSLLATVQELTRELQDTQAELVKRTRDVLHGGEVVLTNGALSSTLRKAFVEAAKRTAFSLYVATLQPYTDDSSSASAAAAALAGASSGSGPAIAGLPVPAAVESLCADVVAAGTGATATAIGVGSVFAAMSHVNKVVVGVYGVAADGSVVAPVGTHAVAVAAKMRGVPFIVVVGQHKISPMFPVLPQELVTVGPPGEAVSFDMLSEIDAADLQVHNANVDHIPPDLITLFITNGEGMVGTAPSYMYRLVAELYNPDDRSLAPMRSRAPAVAAGSV